MSGQSEANSAQIAEIRGRADAWLAGTTRRDLAASKDTADGLARDVLALVAVVEALVSAAAELCGRERDGTWVVYGDEHGDAIREHLLPVVRGILERSRA